jgi:LmbE family N-acetylglucosaminyl deacetylase
VIVPATKNEEWLERLAGIPPLDMLNSPVLVVAPHPDDETLGAGALIATLRMFGVPVTVVAATDGENAYESSLSERVTLGELRQLEQEWALSALGVDPSAIKRLRLTDSGLQGQERVLTEHLLDLAQPGATILAPWIGDFHPDHMACARAAASAASSKNLPLISYFFWTWHRGSPTLLDRLPLRQFTPGPKAIAAKALALSMHRSQLDRPDGEPILPPELLGPAQWPFEIFLPA